MGNNGKEAAQDGAKIGRIKDRLGPAKVNSSRSGAPSKRKGIRQLAERESRKKKQKVIESGIVLGRKW